MLLLSGNSNKELKPLLKYYLPCPRYFDWLATLGPTDLCALPFFLFVFLGAKVLAETELLFFDFVGAIHIIYSIF